MDDDAALYGLPLADRADRLGFVALHAGRLGEDHGGECGQRGLAGAAGPLGPARARQQLPPDDPPDVDPARVPPDLTFLVGAVLRGGGDRGAVLAGAACGGGADLSAAGRRRLAV